MPEVDVGVGLVMVGGVVVTVLVGVVGVGVLVTGTEVVGPPGLGGIDRTTFRVHISNFIADSTYKHWE